MFSHKHNHRLKSLQNSNYDSNQYFQFSKTSLKGLNCFFDIIAYCSIKGGKSKHQSSNTRQCPFSTKR